MQKTSNQNNASNNKPIDFAQKQNTMLRVGLKRLACLLYSFSLSLQGWAHRNINTSLNRKLLSLSDRGGFFFKPGINGFPFLPVFLFYGCAPTNAPAAQIAKAESNLNLWALNISGTPHHLSSKQEALDIALPAFNESSCLCLFGLLVPKNTASQTMIFYRTPQVPTVLQITARPTIAP
jgi:hypothetical protein